VQRQALPNESDELPFFEAHGANESGAAGNLEGFSHLVIEVTDLDRSEAWYRDVIGLDLLGRDLTAEERPHALLQMNTGQLVILVQLSVGDAPHHRLPKRSIIHHAFVLTPNQYRRAWTRVQEYGYDVTDTRLALRAVGEYSIDVTDPDGHRFQLQTYGPEAWEIFTPGVGVVDCGPASRYKVGDVKAFPGGNFYLVRSKQGFLAMTRWCTHKNGIVAYQKAHWRFLCPFHGATYDLQGTPTGRHGSSPLRLNPISFTPDGHLLVDTDQVIAREAFGPEQAVEPPEVHSVV